MLNIHYESVIITIYNILYKEIRCEIGDEYMLTVSNKIKLAQRELGKSVIRINPYLEDEVKAKHKDLKYFGVKDTDQIPKSIIAKLKKNPSYAWLTIDKGSDKGRAIDTDLMNPITYRAMTGSSSGGPINIVKGINDFAIGTDGGGSVLAPAMSCQLPSIIGAGFGLKGKTKKISTDKLEFQASVGVIAKRVSVLKEVMECLTEKRLEPIEWKPLRIAIPKKNSIRCPDNSDMYERVRKHLSAIEIDAYRLEEVDMSGIEDRKKGLELIDKCFHNDQVDMIVTYEGPVDVYGYGETIPQQLGEVGKSITRSHGKYLIRAANMSNTTAITIPTGELASGMVLIAKSGIDNGCYALELARKLEETIKLPEIWKRYFIEAKAKYSGLDFESFLD